MTKDQMYGLSALSTKILDFSDVCQSVHHTLYADWYEPFPFCSCEIISVNVNRNNTLQTIIIWTGVKVVQFLIRSYFTA